MTGIEILTSAQVATEMIFNTTAFWVTSICFFGVAVFIGAIVSISESDLSYVIFISLIGVICGGMTGSMAGSLFAEPATYETQYKVTISDEVSMNDFYEHYEVIDQDGKIFTVRERVE